MRVGFFLKECIEVLFVFLVIINGLVQGYFESIAISPACLVIAIFERFLIQGRFVLIDIILFLILDVILKIPDDRVVLTDHD